MFPRTKVGQKCAAQRDLFHTKDTRVTKSCSQGQMWDNLGLPRTNVGHKMRRAAVNCSSQGQKWDKIMIPRTNVGQFEVPKDKCGNILGSQGQTWDNLRLPRTEVGNICAPKDNPKDKVGRAKDRVGRSRATIENRCASREPSVVLPLPSSPLTLTYLLQSNSRLGSSGDLTPPKLQ